MLAMVKNKLIPSQASTPGPEVFHLNRTNEEMPKKPMKQTRCAGAACPAWEIRPYCFQGTFPFFLSPPDSGNTEESAPGTPAA